MNMRKIQYIFSGIALMTLPLGIHAQQQAKRFHSEPYSRCGTGIQSRHSGCIQNKCASQSGAANCQQKSCGI